MRGLEFYATRSDLTAVLHAVEEKLAVSYAPIEVFSVPPKAVFASFLELPNLGVALQGNAILEQGFLVMAAPASVYVREVPLRKGGRQFSVTQIGNPSSIIFRPGGLFTGESLPGGVFRGHCLIKGEIGTVSHDAASLLLYRTFSDAVRKRFIHVRDSWLGTEALAMFRQGTRLTDNANTRSGDLRPKDDDIFPS